MACTNPSTSNDIPSPIYKHVTTSNHRSGLVQVSPIQANKAIMNALELPPPSAITFASPSSTIITNSDFVYHSDSQDDEDCTNGIELSFGCLYMEDPNQITDVCDDDDDDDDNDNDENNADDEPNDHDTSNMNHAFEYEYDYAYAYDYDYDYDYDNPSDVDDYDRHDVPSHACITPPPPLFISTDVFANNEDNAVTIVKENDYHESSSVQKLSVVIPPSSEAPPTALKPLRTPKPSTLRNSSGKSFEFSVKGSPSYVMNEYLMQHIDSLYDDSVSE